jgi:hypothetical protein
MYKNVLSHVISGCCCKVDEIFALLGCYGVYSGNSVRTVWDNLSVPSPSHFINTIDWHHTYWEPITAHMFSFINHVPRCHHFPAQIAWPLQLVPINCLETVVRNYHYMLHNIPEECRSQCFISLHALSRKHKITVLITGTPELWALSIKLVSCHPSGMWNLEVVPKVLESLCCCGLRSSGMWCSVAGLVFVHVLKRWSGWGVWGHLHGPLQSWS